MNPRGFTMIEVVIVLAVVAILSAVLIPVVGNSIQQARIARTASDTQTIGKAMVQFRQDTGKWPSFNNNQPPVTSYALLFGTGALPGPDAGGVNWLVTPQTRLDDFLVQNRWAFPAGPARIAQGLPTWNGPYISDIRNDPWGNAYLCNVQNLPDGGNPNANNRVFVLSAGPDQLTDTDFAGTVGVADDDIAFRLQ